VEQWYLVIVASAAIVMGLLSWREPLHELARRVSEEDIYATAKFIILAAVVLPILPDRAIDPLQVLNPYHIGLMIVLISGISFLAYVATRVFGGKKSLVLIGILGGLISSTAVTITLSRRVRESAETLTLGAVAILAASGTMCVRIVTVVAIVDPPLVPILVWPLSAITVSAYGWTLHLYFRARREGLHEAQPVLHRNPFELRLALKFGLLYAALTLLTKMAERFLGAPGLYLSSVLAGTTDVDAITLSMLKFHLEGLPSSTAAIAIILAAATNTLIKAGLAAWEGGRQLGRLVSLGLLSALAIGGLVTIMEFNFSR
jgi:uncharacterized membrane protein (DUF4010 family)